MDDLELECCSPLYSEHVFVFGSNVAGRHGLGAARHAVECHGAILGNGVGPQGASYAIPTKDARLRPLAVERIGVYVDDFIQYAREHAPGSSTPLTFYVTRVGCGYAGYSDAEIAPLFRDAPLNCTLPRGWRGK